MNFKTLILMFALVAVSLAAGARGGKTVSASGSVTAAAGDGPTYANFNSDN